MLPASDSAVDRARQSWNRQFLPPAGHPWGAGPLASVQVPSRFQPRREFLVDTVGLFGHPMFERPRSFEAGGAWNQMDFGGQRGWQVPNELRPYRVVEIGERPMQDISELWHGNYSVPLNPGKYAVVQNQNLEVALDPPASPYVRPVGNDMFRFTDPFAGAATLNRRRRQEALDNFNTGRWLDTPYRLRRR